VRRARQPRHALRDGKTRVFVPDLTMTGFSRDVRKARLHLIREGYSYGRAAQLIGVSKDLVKSVLTGRKRSARALAGVMGLKKPEWLKEWEKKHAAKVAAGLEDGGQRCQR
jgi:transposase